MDGADLARLSGSENKLGGRAWAGIQLLGFAGVAMLIGPSTMKSSTGLNMWATAGAPPVAVAWAVGTIFSKRVRMHPSPVSAAAMQMMAGGALLFAASLATGEPAHMHLSQVTMKSALALAYLTVMGSIVAFTVFTWLLTVASASQVSTYAYVNPAVAVFIGWALGGETVASNTVVATAIILISVALVTRPARTQKAEPAAETNYEVAAD